VINIPAVALGMFSGGVLMKRLKLNIMGAAKFAFCTSLIGYVLSMFFFAMSCENAKVAGVFSNCSCVGVAGNFTAATSQCPDKDDCDRMFPYFLALSVITSFIISLGGTPGYMFLIRSDSNL
ncbi:hypothetical protein XENOCAPTIV_020506, partial [Xenoophorus captivus]